MRALALIAALALTAALPAALPAAAQERPNLMIVFDGSGSMWGQVGGRPKIELARQALSSVLAEADAAMEIGMLAYGHRVRGQCSDIELMVPMGPAAQTVAPILEAANRMNPRGMTPLSDAVLIAAQRMGYTEQAATVVLLTDGIETCGGDPCALGRLLASEGIDFRAHVVGFDLTDDEQQQVACLAEETGGLFLAANSADELRAALAVTLAAEPAALPEPEPEPEPEPVAAPRPVTLILRDVAGGPVLTGRPFRTVEFQPLDPAAAPAGRLDLALNAPTERTGRVELLPGRYTLRLVRETQGREVIRVALPVEIPEGEGPHTVDLVIAARLQINGLLHAGQPLPPGRERFASLAGRGWAEFNIHPVIDGAIDPAIDYGGINSQDVAVPPGDYFVRGVLSGVFTREALVTASPGVTTTVDFDFAAAPVSVDLRDAQGFAVDRVRVEVFDLDAAEPFVSGRGRDRTEIVPAFLPEGTWRITAREDRGGSRRAEAWVTVVPGQPVTLSLTPGMQADPGAIPETALPLCLDTHRAQGCVVQAVTPAQVADFQGLPPPPPRFTGTWQTQGGMMALIQDGRRVWGEVYINGGVGTVWGHVAPDGLTLRGAMDASSNPRGATEMHLAADGRTLQGVWDHNIGRMRSDLRARRLSGGVPPLAVATGTDDDLRIGMNGAPWAPADSPEFAAFMEPAQAPASPDTGDDIDAMQAAAPPPSFSGTWDSNHQVLTLVQEGRRVTGRRDRGPILGEVSADGQVMRGVWINLPRDWGLLEFRLNPDRTAFEGGWGRLRDGGANQRWTGRRISWLGVPVDPADYPAEATGEVWEAFMAPVRDPDPEPVPPALPDRTEAPAAPGIVPAAADGLLIGTIDSLPERGIFAALADRPGEALDAAFARLFDPLDVAQADRMSDVCWQEPWVVHPDGLIAERRIDRASGRAGGPGYRTTRYQLCEQAGPLAFCRVFQRPLAPAAGAPDFDYRAEVVAGPHGSFALRDTETGRAMLYRSCEGELGFLNPSDRWDDGRLLIDTMFDREDRDSAAAAPAPAPETAPASPPVPASASGGASPLPPGLWHAEAPWSDPVPARGTPAFADRCSDEISATWPDGLTIGFERQDTATGPAFFAVWAERCVPSGAADFPFVCQAEDANLSDDVGADPSVSRLRLDSVAPEAVRLTLSTEWEEQPFPVLLHACHGPGGLDLTADPRGRALARALAEARPGVPLPVAAAAPAPAPTPAKPAAAAPAAADPRPGLAGLWFPIRDGRRPAMLTDDEVAAACFESPLRFHPDGLAMFFATRDGLPVADGHLRCAADLSCSFARGGPSEGRRVEGQARLTPVTEAEIEACLGAQCTTLGRCPAPDWSARERAAGLADRWESAVERRD